jgi:nitroreductase
VSGFSFLKLVERRFSLRRYDADRRLSDHDLLFIFEAARLAPSAENSQPWRFVIVRDPAVRARLARECFSGMYLPTRFAGEAPAIVALCANRARIIKRAGELILQTALYQLDCGIAGEHLALAAAERGIGSCWIGWFNKRKARKVLGLPPYIEVVALIALGYPREGTPARRKIRQPLSSIVSLDRWGEPFPPAVDQDGVRK